MIAAPPSPPPTPPLPYALARLYESISDPGNHPAIFEFIAFAKKIERGMNCLRTLLVAVILSVCAAAAGKFE